MSLVNSSIEFSNISIVSSSGDIVLDNSVLITNGLIFNTTIKKTQLCLSTSGYCFYSATEFQTLTYTENTDWLKFESSDIYSLDTINTTTGKGDKDAPIGGGGRILLGAKNLYVKNNSSMSSNGFLSSSVDSWERKSTSQNVNSGKKSTSISYRRNI